MSLPDARSLITISISALSLCLLAACGPDETTSRASGESSPEAQPAASEESTETSPPGTGAPATIKATLENHGGARISVTMNVHEPVDGLTALASDAGSALQSHCSDYNLTANLDQNSTQVVPIDWVAVDETAGGFEWEMTTDLLQQIKLPPQHYVGAENIWTSTGFYDCHANSAAVAFAAGEGYAFAYASDAYNPNNPSGGFHIYNFAAGVTGTVTACDVEVADPTAFEGALTPVESETECLLRGPA